MSDPASDETFDFDAWAALARRDPEAFERRRAELVERMIARAPHHRRQRLRGLQWRIEMLRRRSGTPLAACLRIMDLMWASAFELHGALHENLQEPSRADAAASEPEGARRPGARVIPFPAPPRDLS